MYVEDLHKRIYSIFIVVLVEKYKNTCEFTIDSEFKLSRFALQRLIVADLKHWQIQSHFHMALLKTGKCKINLAIFCFKTIFFYCR